MAQEPITAARPLPGLAKLYLLHLYPLALIMLLARFSFASLGLGGLDERIEPLIWSIIFLCFGAASATVIAGIHLRTDWAPRYAACLNLGLCFLAAAGFARILALIAGMGRGRYSFDEDQIFTAMALGSLAMYIPIFFAWRRYFSGSRKLLGTFGLPQDGRCVVPPAGVGILQTLSASFVFFYLACFLVLGASGGAKAFSGGGYLLLALTLPPLVLLAALFILSYSPGKKQRPLLAGLTFTAAFMLVWACAPSYIIALMQRLDVNHSLYSVVHTFSALPANATVMGTLAAILAWKIWADPKEQRWFADGHNEGRSPAAFSLYNIVLLYYASYPMMTSGLQIIYLLGNDYLGPMEYFIAALTVLLVLLHAAALYNRTKKRWNDKTLSLASFAASGAFSLFIMFMLCKDIFFGADPRPALYSLLHNVPLYLGPLAAALTAMLHWRAVYGPGRAEALPDDTEAPRARGIFALEGPSLAFALFCILLVTEALSKKTAELCVQIFITDDNYFRRESGSLAAQLLNFEFWAAYVVFPLLALKWLLSGFARLRNFYVFGIIWVCAMLASMVNSLLGVLSRSGLYDFSYPLSMVLDPMKQVYIYAVILFMVYLSSTRGKRPDAPENR